MPARFIGTCSAKASTTSWPPYCRTPSVWIRPGATQTARIPNADHSERDPRGERLESAARHRGVHHRSGSPRRGLNPRNAMNPERCGIIQRSRHPLGDVPGGVDVQPVNGAQALQRGVARAAPRTARRRCSRGCRRARAALRDRVEERRDLLGLADVARHAPMHASPSSLRDRGDRLGATAADRDACRRRATTARAVARADPGAAAGHDRRRCPRARRPRAATGTPLPCRGVCRGSRRIRTRRGAARRARVRRPAPARPRSCCTTGSRRASGSGT